MTTDTNPNPQPLDPETQRLVDEALAQRAALANTAHLSHLEADAFGSAEIPEGRHSAPVCTMPPSEMLMSLTGFDEIAIAIRFGQKIATMREEDAVTTGRALAFVWYRRQGQRDDVAYESSMGLTLRGVVEFFAPEPTSASAEGEAPSA